MVQSIEGCRLGPEEPAAGVSGRVASRMVALMTSSRRPLTEKDFAVHLNPVWRARANFIIDANIESGDSARRYEQLWARKLTGDGFEICCIPVFAYDLALGDEVITRREGERLYVVDRVVKPSGRFTFRVWFGDSPNPGVRDTVIEYLDTPGVLYEWYSPNLLAVDAESEEIAQAVADFLKRRPTGRNWRTRLAAPSNPPLIADNSSRAVFTSGTANYTSDGLREIRYGAHEVGGQIHHIHFEALENGHVVENTRALIIP
jgi:hypothetical protein